MLNMIVALAGAFVTRFWPGVASVDELLQASTGSQLMEKYTGVGVIVRRANASPTDSTASRAPVLLGSGMAAPPETRTSHLPSAQAARLVPSAAVSVIGVGNEEGDAVGVVEIVVVVVVGVVVAVAGLEGVA